MRRRPRPDECHTRAPEALAGLRIGTAAVLFAEACSTASDLPAFVGARGVVQSPVREALVHWSLPRLEWLAEPARALGLTESWLIYLVLGTYLLALALMALGWRTRSTACIAWLAHLTLKTSGSASAYGAFEFGTIALAYCAVMPTARVLALDPPPRRARDSDFATTLSVWVLRIHLAIVYVSSGIAKASGDQWRTGEAIWRAVMRPDVVGSFSWLAAVPSLAAVATWSVVLLEIGYGMAVWWRRARPALLAAIVALHLGIAVTLNLWFFSGLMIVLNCAALTPRVRWPLPARRRSGSPAFPPPCNLSDRLTGARGQP